MLDVTLFILLIFIALCKMFETNGHHYLLLKMENFVGKKMITD